MRDKNQHSPASPGLTPARFAEEALAWVAAYKAADVDAAPILVGVIRQVLGDALGDEEGLRLALSKLSELGVPAPLGVGTGSASCVVYPSTPLSERSVIGELWAATIDTPGLVPVGGGSAGTAAERVWGVPLALMLPQEDPHAAPGALTVFAWADPAYVDGTSATESYGQAMLQAVAPAGQRVSLDNARELFERLRDEGWAVAAFTPEEIEAADPDHQIRIRDLEAAMVSAGWCLLPNGPTSNP